MSAGRCRTCRARHSRFHTDRRPPGAYRNSKEKLHMIKINFIDHGGTERSVEVEEGTSLMEAAVQNLIPGIDGDCGGCCACATCHVHIEAKWRDRIPPMEDQENQMLGLLDSRDADSRLGCQVKASPELDGIVVRTPIGQH